MSDMETPALSAGEAEGQLTGTVDDTSATAVEDGSGSAMSEAPEETPRRVSLIEQLCIRPYGTQGRRQHDASIAHGDRD